MYSRQKKKGKDKGTDKQVIMCKTSTFTNLFIVANMLVGLIDAFVP